MEEQLIRETGLTTDDLQSLRETFVAQYVRKKGWDVNNLTTDQLNEIRNQKGYKMPLLLS
jgi:hypothetical protein